MSRPTVFPTGTTIFHPKKAWGGYTLFTAPGKGVALINMNGAVVHFWKDLQAFPPKMIRGGKVFGSLGQRKRYEAYQDYLDLTEVDWDGSILWSFDKNQKIHDSDTGVRHAARQHHDFQIEGNPVGYYVPGQESRDDFDRVLLLTHNDVKKSLISSQSLLEDVLIEVDREGNILWTWHMLDHFDEFFFTEAQKNAIFRDPNTQPAGPEGEGDIFHVNCASYLGPNRFYDAGDERFASENIILDSREANIMFIVSRKTGKVVWSLGPDFTREEKTKKLNVLIGLHHSHMIPRGLPGEGNILVFDNGGWAGYGLPSQVSETGLKTERRDSSRVLEFDPVTLKVVWSFDASDLGFSNVFNAHFFYSPLVSSAQRLPNGNTLITEGCGGRFLEVTPKKEVVWEYVYPYSGNDLIYRAYRVPYEWIPQLAKPKEIPVVPPENDSFHLKGASDPAFHEEAGVSVTGTLGFQKQQAFCVVRLK